MTRVRQNQALHNTFLFQDQTWNNHAPDHVQLNASWAGIKKQVVDEVIPRFHYRKRKGEVIVNACDMWTWERQFSPGVVTYYSGQPDAYDVTTSGDIASLAEASFPRDSSLESLIPLMRDTALVKAYAKIRGTTICSGELLSDLGATMMMLRKPFSGARKHLVKMHKSASRHYKKTARSISQANADAWLEYRYAMLPTLLDADAGLQLVAEAYNNLQARRLVVRGAIVREVDKTTTFNQAGPFSDFSLRLGGTVRTVGKIAVHAGVIYDVKHRTREEEVSEELRLGTDSLIQTAYEKLPFSFVADWLIGIGPWLEAKCLPPSVVIQGSWTSTRISYKWDTSVSLVERYLGGQWNGGPGGSSTNMFEQNVRIPSPQLPSTPIPDIDMVSVLHVADGLSLSLNPILDLVKKLRR